LSGDIFAAADSFEQAERAYTGALQRDDGFFYHYLRRGQVRFAQEKFAAARLDLERSQALLPTAQASYLRGDLDKRAGNLQSAVKHYQVASQSNSPVGKQAQKELVLLELPGNPGKYIQAKAVLAQDGTVLAAVKNNAPLTVTNIRLKVEYIDASGQLREFSRSIRETLNTGELAAAPTQISDISDVNELTRRVRVTVLSAKVVE